MTAQSLKAQALIAMLCALAGWLTFFAGYIDNSMLISAVGGVLFVAAILWLLVALVVGYVRQHFS